MIAKGIVSPRWLCRKNGCTDYVPSGGYYVGMPQAHCYYCHAKQTSCREGGKDFSEPYRLTWIDKFMNWWEKP